MSKVSKFGLSFRNKMTTEVKPTKPLTSFFLFKRDNQAKVAEFPRGEQAKELGRLWQELSDDEKNAYSKRHKDAMEQYTYDLEQWYLAHPEERIKDKEEVERQRQKNREKKEKEKRPGQQSAKVAQKRSKAVDADNLLMCFTVAQLKKRRLEFSDVPIYPTNTVKRTIKTALNEMSDADKELWLNFWYDLDEENKNKVKQFYLEWKELKAKD